MKTKNNVQKTILRFAAVVISFVLISFTVSGQEFWKKLIAGSSFNEIALAMVDHSKKMSPNSDVVNKSFDFTTNRVVDETLKVEPWMIGDDKYFGKAMPIIAIETDTKLEVEPWMLNEKLFEVPDTEERLNLESWMISDFIWK